MASKTTKGRTRGQTDAQTAQQAAQPATGRTSRQTDAQTAQPATGRTSRQTDARSSRQTSAQSSRQTSARKTPRTELDPLLDPQGAHIGIADALFPTTHQRVLAHVFGEPDRTFQGAELIRIAGSGSGAVQRLLIRLTRSGLLSMTRIGNQRHYQANSESPIFAELSAIIRKTVGIVEPLRHVLEPHQDQIAARSSMVLPHKERSAGTIVQAATST